MTVFKRACTPSQGGAAGWFTPSYSAPPSCRAALDRGNHAAPDRRRRCSPPSCVPRSGHRASQPVSGRLRIPAPGGIRVAPLRTSRPARASGRRQRTKGPVMTARWPAPAGLHTSSARLPVEGKLPSFDGATGWLNSPPLTATDLKSKIIIVNFWTYTCINWLRQLPYLRAWAEKYADHDLTVIGVHTPEFRFEHNPDNVHRAVHDLRIDYPVAMDNGYAVWTAFDNHYWPALYFADTQGRLRHHHFGEGEYQQSENGHPPAAGRGKTNRP